MGAFIPKSEVIKSTQFKMNIFTHTVDSLTGHPIKLSDFKGSKAYLIVNVARK